MSEDTVVNTGPEWVEDDGSGFTCIDCKYMKTGKECGGSEKYMCEKFNYLIAGSIDKKCKEFEES